MRENHDYFFKIADRPAEFTQIHELNYHTFSEEIPQHPKNSDKKLMDSFHEENTYIICLKQEEVIGMIAIRAHRPFSLDRKIGPVEESLPFTIQKPCEIRLLAVKIDYRQGRVFLGLVQFLIKYCLKNGYDIALISGTVRQLKLYGQMGFQPFAMLTGANEASYQPMYLTKETFEASIAGRLLRPPTAFLPGPVSISDEVRAAFDKDPYSHRSALFKDKMDHVKEQLCRLVDCRYTQVLLGTGTLANDLVAAQLSLEPGRGVILTNGEFGSRLVEQAQRAGLDFDVLDKEWGLPFSHEEIAACITDETAWIWAVHSETSTGMLNNLNILKAVAQEHRLKLCLDCISSIGAVDLDLSGVFLATGVSGKALKSYTGLSFVFHHHKVAPSPLLPTYLDLGTYAEKESIPFSQSSNLVEALLTAINSVTQERLAKIAATHQSIRQKLSKYGFQLITAEENSSPIIVTVPLPKTTPSAAVGELLYCNGYLLHYESEYLRQRNWIQIACIEDYSKEQIEKMAYLFHQAYKSWCQAPKIMVQ